MRTKIHSLGQNLRPNFDGDLRQQKPHFLSLKKPIHWIIAHHWTILNWFLITNQWCFILKRGLLWSLSENRVPKIAWLIINGPAKKVYKRMTHGLLPFLRQSLSPPQGLHPSENVIRPSENKAQISMILFTSTQSNMLKMMHSDLYKQDMQPALWQVAVTMAQPLGIDTWRGRGKGQSSRRKTSWVCSKILGD